MSGCSLSLRSGGPQDDRSLFRGGAPAVGHRRKSHQTQMRECDERRRKSAVPALGRCCVLGPTFSGAASEGSLYQQAKGPCLCAEWLWAPPSFSYDLSPPFLLHSSLALGALTTSKIPVFFFVVSSWRDECATSASDAGETRKDGSEHEPVVTRMRRSPKADFLRTPFELPHFFSPTFLSSALKSILPARRKGKKNYGT